MIKKFVWWLFCVVISVVLQNVGMVENYKVAFCNIYIGAGIVTVCLMLLIVIIATAVSYDGVTSLIVTLVLAVVTAVCYAAIFFVSWLISKLAGVDIYTTYMILSAGGIFFGNTSSKEKD